MVRRITDTNEACRPYCLNLPFAYKAIFHRIDPKSMSKAARQLIDYAIANGVLESLPPGARDLTPRARSNTTLFYQAYNLNLPASYAAIFASITARSASNACRVLLEYALSIGALEDLLMLQAEPYAMPDLPSEQE